MEQNGDGIKKQMKPKNPVLQITRKENMDLFKADTLGKDNNKKKYDAGDKENGNENLKK